MKLLSGLATGKSFLMLSVAAGLLASANAFAANLLEVHDQALRNDPQLQAADFRRHAGKENKPQAWANFLPQANISYRRNYGNGRFFRDLSAFPEQESPDVPNEISTRNITFTVTQRLFSFRDFAQLKQADALVNQNEAQYRTAYQDFLLRTAQRYFDVLTGEDGLRFAKAEEKALQRQFEQAEQRFEVGLTAVTDVHEARASYDGARARVIVAENTLQDAYEALREITGTEYNQLDVLRDEVPLESPDPNDSSDWVLLALTNNPSLEDSRMAAESARQNIRIQRAANYPELDLVASHSRFLNGKNSIFDDFGNEIGQVSQFSRDRQISFQLNIPLFQGGRTISRTRQAKFEHNATLKDLERTERTTVRNTQNAFRDVEAGIQQVEARQQALVSAQSALEATQAGFEVGTRTIVDVLLAEQRFFQAQRDYSQARHQFILDHLTLRQAAGVLDGSDLVDVNRLLLP
ncbi:MAG: TolC family outer membrane protein [Xanthomonadales bacterium]|nr:TolC family outer membrane protein [Xanthomonadales bacterium]